MIPIMLWSESSTGVISNEVRINCDDFDISEDKLCYRASRTNKGRARQDWYSTFNKFTASFTNIRDEDKELIRALIKEQVEDIVLFFDNNFYKIIIADNSHSWKPLFSSVYNENVWTGKLNMEEIFGEKDMENTYIPQPVGNIEDGIDPDTVVPSGYSISGDDPTIPLYDRSKTIIKIGFSDEIIYESGMELVKSNPSLQGANSGVAGYSGELFINCSDDTSRIMSETLAVAEAFASMSDFTSVYMFGGVANSSVTTTQKRSMSDESVEILATLSPDTEYSLCVGDNTKALLLGGIFYGTSYINRFTYSTEIVEELVEEVSSSGILGGTVNSLTHGYYFFGREAFDEVYTKQIEKTSLSTYTSEIIVDELSYSNYYTDGVNSQTFGYMIQQVDYESGNDNIAASHKISFADDIITLMGQEVSPVRKNPTAFQSGGFY